MSRPQNMMMTMQGAHMNRTPPRQLASTLASTLALGRLLACASPLAQAELSISVGLNPYGYVLYPGPVSVYPPGPVYYPPPVIYLGEGRWGHDDDDDRPPPRPNHGHGPHPGPGQTGAGGPHGRDPRH